MVNREPQARYIRRRPTFSETAVNRIGRWGITGAGVLATVALLNLMYPSSGARPQPEPSTPTQPHPADTLTNPGIRLGSHPDTYTGTTITFLDCRKYGVQINDSTVFIGTALIADPSGNRVLREPDVSSEVVGGLTQGETIAVRRFAIVTNSQTQETYADLQPGFVHVKTKSGEHEITSAGIRGLKECEAGEANAK